MPRKVVIDAEDALSGSALKTYVPRFYLCNKDEDDAPVAKSMWDKKWNMGRGL